MNVSRHSVRAPRLQGASLPRLVAVRSRPGGKHYRLTPRRPDRRRHVRWRLDRLELGRRRRLGLRSLDAWIKLVSSTNDSEGKSSKTMRKLNITLAIVLFALAVLALAGRRPDALCRCGPRRLAEGDRHGRPLLLLAILAGRRKLEPARTAAEAVTPARGRLSRLIRRRGRQFSRHSSGKRPPGRLPDGRHSGLQRRAGRRRRTRPA